MSLHRIQPIGNRSLLGGVVVMLLAGCTSYHALPLPPRDNLQNSLAAAITAAPAGVTLSLGNVGRLAVMRAPVLQALRGRVEVEKARAYAAGLLPDPRLGLSGDYLLSGPDSFNGWSAGLDAGLIALITRGRRHQAARARYAAALLGWRWQAEQVALKARLAYLRLWSVKQEIGYGRQARALLGATLRAARRARAAGALTTLVYARLETRWVALQSRLGALDRAELRFHARLANLLALRATTPLRLHAPAAVRPVAAAGVDRALASLAARRLDLRALRAGYAGADARLRAAILAQFPLLSLGLNRSRDTAGNNAIGLGISLRLPVFNGNRGQIAIARATRRALRAAYLLHLDTGMNRILSVHERLDAVGRLLVAARSHAPAIEHGARGALAAVRAGAMNRLAAYAAYAAWMNQQALIVRLDTEKIALTLTLRTLLGFSSFSGRRR